MKIFLSAALGMIGTFCERYGLILMLVAGAIVLDFATGLIKAKISGVGFDSKIGWKGFWKKMALLAALFFGVYLDGFLPVMVESAGVEITTSLPFGLMMGCYIIINEAISVCENLYACDPHMIPQWIVNLLRIAKDKLEEGENNK